MSKFFLFGSGTLLKSIYWLVPLYYWGLLLYRGMGEGRGSGGFWGLLFGYSGVIFHVVIWWLGVLLFGWNFNIISVFWGVMSLFFGYFAVSISFLGVGLRRGFFFWAGGFSVVWGLSLGYSLESNFSVLLSAGIFSVGLGLLLVVGGIVSVVNLGVMGVDGDFDRVSVGFELERLIFRLRLSAVAVLGLSFWKLSLFGLEGGNEFLWVVPPLLLALIQSVVPVFIPRGERVYPCGSGLYLSLFSGLFVIFWSVIFTVSTI